MSDIALFAGTSNTKLSEEIAQKLGISLSKSVVTLFGNSEIKVRIEDNVKDKICIVIQSTSNPTNDSFMELTFFCDALKRQGARKVIGFVPYFGYAKQNIQHLPGECVSANVVIRFLESIGFAKIYVFDLHDEATAGVFSIPFSNMSALPLMARHIRTYFENQSINIDTVQIVSPDQGGVEKVRNFGKAFYNSDAFTEVVIEKKRDQYTPHKAEPIDLYGDIEGKIALIVDDMVVSGSTIVPACNLCLEKGATKVFATAIHPDFTKDAPEYLQNSKIERFFTTNTITIKKEHEFPKLEQVSVGDLLVSEIKNIAL
jgi:ribose-phosphate pyrophosphokinase